MIWRELVNLMKTAFKPIGYEFERLCLHDPPADADELHSILMDQQEAWEKGMNELQDRVRARGRVIFHLQNRLRRANRKLAILHNQMKQDRENAKAAAACGCRTISTAEALQKISDNRRAMQKEIEAWRRRALVVEERERARFQAQQRPDGSAAGTQLRAQLRENKGAPDQYWCHQCETVRQPKETVLLSVEGSMRMEQVQNAYCGVCREKVEPMWMVDRLD